MATAMTAPAKVTAADLLEMLHRHHGLTGPAEQWAGGTLVAEVSPNGPATTSRRADAVYIGYTSASGRRLVGYEIKTSRSDWRREIARAADKADFWADQCHEWWIVVSDPAIVKDDELPHGWGLMSPPTGTDHRMTIHVRAHLKRDHTPSWDAVRAIMSRLETLRAATVKKQLWHIEQEIRRTVRQEVEAELAKRRGPDAAELQRRLNLLENALGVHVDWGDKRLGRPGVDIDHFVRLGAAAREYGGVVHAVEAITGRFANPIAAVRNQLDYLERELNQLRDAGAPAMPAEQP